MSEITAIYKLALFNKIKNNKYATNSALLSGRKTMAEKQRS
jgi:hypothetical protein